MFAHSGIKVLFLSALIAVFVFGSFLGISHFGMDTSMRDGQMVHCPFMPGVAICNMTPLQHMAAAQTAFTAIPQIDIALLLLMLLSVLIASLLIRKVPAFPARAVRLVSIFTAAPAFAHRPLQEAFSNGILHSKAF